MSIVSSLIALTLLCVENPRGASDHINYRIQVLDMEGVDWRGAMHSQLNPVTTRGLPCVWTASSDLPALLSDAAAAQFADWQIQCVTDTEASAFRGTDRRFVSRLNRIANGPENQATAVGFEPDVDVLKDGLSIGITGRVQKEGVRARIAAVDTRFKALHTVAFSEKLKKAGGQDAENIIGQYQVPEVERTSVNGEWMIPADGVLILSLGLRTVRNADTMKDDVLERIAVIGASLEASHAAGVPATLEEVVGSVLRPTGGVRRPGAPTLRPTADSSVQPARHAAAAVVPGPAAAVETFSPSLAALAVALASPTAELPTIGPPAIPAPVVAVLGETPEMPAPMPAAPARSFPIAVAPDGSPIDLPPLPDDSRSSDATEPAAVPGPSSQARHVPRMGSSPELTLAEIRLAGHDDSRALEPVDDCCLQIPSTCHRELPTAVAESSCGAGDSCAARMAGSRDEPYELWTLTVENAVRTALRNSAMVRVVASSAGKPTVIAPRGSEGASPRFHAEIRALVRSVHQQYWALVVQETRLQTAGTAVNLCEQALGRERVKREAGLDAVSSLAEARNTVDRLRFELAAAAAESMCAGVRAHNLMGMQPAVTRVIVGVTKPTTTRTPAEWTCCLAAMRATNADIHDAKAGLHRARALAALTTHPRLIPGLDKAGGAFDGATIRAVGLGVPDVQAEVAAQESILEGVRRSAEYQLSRSFLAVETCWDEIEIAEQAARKTAARLEEKRTLLDSGRVPLQAYFDTVRRWTNAVAHQAEARARYDIALVALEEACGTLLRRDHIIVADRAQPAPCYESSAMQARDSRTARAVHTSELSGCLGSEADSVSADPFVFRFPIGEAGIVEIRAAVSRIPAAGRNLPSQPR